MGPELVGKREQLGEALTELRIRAGLSVRDVADQSDALLGTVAGWFAGQHAPTKASRDMFERVLRVCGVADDELSAWWEAIERISRRGGRRRTRPEPPYRGFASFGPADSRWYFGRADLVTRLAELVVEQRSAARSARASGTSEIAGVMVVGTSGVGKSSLVRAGLLGNIDDAAQPAPAGWCSAIMVPGVDPVAALREALAGVDVDDVLVGTDADADDVLADAGTADTVPLILVIDQLEELWTQCTGVGRGAFDAALADLFDTRDVVVVGVLRADFYGSAANIGWVAAVLEKAQVVVPAMSVRQLREVILRPAEVAGVGVDDDLVEMLIDDVTPTGGEPGPGVLPLLSHALRATWDHSDGRRLTVADYVATGRIAGAVEKTAEEVYAALDADEQVAARELLLAMINVDEETVTRRTIGLAELGADTGVRRQVLERFAAARLVTVSPSHAQVTHEALLSAWPRLTGWIDADREKLLLLRRLRTLSEPWAAHGRPDDLLPGEARVAMFDQLSAGAGTFVVDRTSREFLDAGRAKLAADVERETRRTRQLRRFAVFATVFGVVAVLAAVIAVVAGMNAVSQRRDAEQVRNQALSRQLAVQSTELANRDRSLSAQLAMVAYQSAHTVEARSTLVDVMSSDIPERYQGVGGAQLMARAGTLLAAAAAGGQVRLFRVSEGPDTVGITSQITEFSATANESERLGRVALSPDARTLYLGGTDSLTEWDVSDPARPAWRGAIPGVAGDVNILAMSPDGTMMVGAVPDAGVQAWVRRPDGWQPLPLPPLVAGVAGAVAFSPDGRLLATSSVNRRIDLWRVNGGALDHVGDVELGWHDNELAQGLAFLPDSRHLAAALRSRTIDVFDVGNPAAPTRTAQFGGFTSYVSAVAINRAGTTIAGAGADNTVRIFDVTTPNAAPRVLTSVTNVSSLAFVGDDLVTAGDEGRVQDWPNGAKMTAVGTNNVFQIPADAAATRMLAADTAVDGRLTQWRIAGQQLISAGPDLLPPPGVIYSGAIGMGESGDYAVAGTVDGTLHVADLRNPATPRVIGTVRAQQTLNETVAYSERSGLALTGGTDSHILAVVDASTRERPRAVGTLDVGGGVWWASLSPDGRTAAVATTSGTVTLIDLADPARPTVLSTPIRFDGAALAVRFSADGRRIVATSQVKTVQVVDVSSPRAPRVVASMDGPAGQLYSAAFSPDGRRVVAGGSNSEVWVWELTDSGAREELVLRSFPGRVYDVRFTDDNTVFAAGEGGVVKSWQLDPNGLIDTQCRRPGDQISPSEWRIYLPDNSYAPPCG